MDSKAWAIFCSTKFCTLILILLCIPTDPFQKMVLAKSRELSLINSVAAKDFIQCYPLLLQLVSVVQELERPLISIFA